MDSSENKLYTITDCKLMTFGKHHRPNGNLTVVAGGEDVQFDIRRVYYIYDVPSGEDRGGHAHKNLQQLIIAVSGSFDVVIDDGSSRKTITLNRPYCGLLLRPGIWRELNNFSSGAVTLVLASDLFTEDDYIRDYKEFLAIKGLL
ncbi:MAG: FdtA/QdtA family cupin domain-containing protein [Bacteroidales bacterium]